MRTLMIASTLLVLLAGVVVAQETETEREAGRDVVKQIHELDQSLNIPQMVARLTAPAPVPMRESGRTATAQLVNSQGGRFAAKDVLIIITRPVEPSRQRILVPVPLAPGKPRIRKVVTGKGFRIHLEERKD